MYAIELSETEYAKFYSNYIKLAGDKNLISGIASSFEDTLVFFKTIPEYKLEYSYQEGKWTIKDILQHMIDSERVFAYRALCFSRQDKAQLPGFEENAYAVTANAKNRSWEDLLNEYQVVREATLWLFKSMTQEMLMQIGVANNTNISVRAIGFIIIGHEKHHCQIIKSRYL